MNNMEKEFVNYNQALKLKALGFDEPCFGYYVDGELRGINLGIEELGGIEPYYQTFGFHTLSNHNIDNPNKIVVTAPTFSQCFKWFREKYGLSGWINESYIGNSRQGAISIKSEIGLDYRVGATKIFETYEEAELACLDELLEIVESKSE